MLQAIRSKAGSLVVKVLFAVLIVAFGFWGIGSWINDRNVDNTIATVGRVKIPAEQLTAAVRAQVQNLRQTYGPSFDIEQAKQLGIVSDQLDQLIDDSLVNQEVGRLQLAVGDDAVRALILGNPTFAGPGGQFDRLRYQQILRGSRMSEGQYEASVRNQVVRDVRAAWLSANTAFQRVGVAAELAKEADLSLNLAQGRYQLGLGSIVELSQAQLQQTDAAIGYVNAQYQYRLALSTLNFEIGVQP